MADHTTMDHLWFRAVRKSLEDLEQQKAQRYRVSKDQEVDKELFKHPYIVSSRFWNPADQYVTSDCFDWSARYPAAYLKYLRVEVNPIVEKLAMRTYSVDPYSSEKRMENTKTMVARILLLKLDYVFPEG